MFEKTVKIIKPKIGSIVLTFIFLCLSFLLLIFIAYYSNPSGGSSSSGASRTSVGFPLVYYYESTYPYYGNATTGTGAFMRRTIFSVTNLIIDILFWIIYILFWYIISSFVIWKFFRGQKKKR